MTSSGNTNGPARACVFDAYGTLFDVHAASRAQRTRLGARADAVSERWRAKQLEYTWLRSLMGRHADFWQVTADALDHVLEAFAIDDPPLRMALLDAYLHLDAFPEVRAVLTELRARCVPCAILSNGSRSMLDAAVASAGLAGLLDEVISVDEVGVYKPDPRVYQLAVDRLGVPAPSIAFLSSNALDAVGAASFGFRRSGSTAPGNRRNGSTTGQITS